MLEPIAPTTTLLEEPTANGNLRLGLDVRPEAVTFVAQLRLYERPPSGEPAQSLDAHRDWARDFLERVRDQVRPVIEAATGRLIASLSDENQRLRAALADCAGACGELVGRVEESGCEGCEGEQARAWLALDRAREALAAPAALTLPPG